MKWEDNIKRALCILSLELAINQIYKDSIFNGHYFPSTITIVDTAIIRFDTMEEAIKEDKWLLDEMKLLDAHIK